MLALFAGPIPTAQRQTPPSKAATRTADPAEPPKPQTEPQKPQRTIYQVQHGDAAAIARVVGKLFKNEVDVIAAPTGNAILVGGRPAAVEEALQMIAMLDRARGRSRWRSPSPNCPGRTGPS